MTCLNQLEREKYQTKLWKPKEHFKGSLKTYVITKVIGTLDPSKFLKASKRLVTNKDEEQLKNIDLKVNVFPLADYKRGLGKNSELMEENVETENSIILKVHV